MSFLNNISEYLPFNYKTLSYQEIVIGVAIIIFILTMGVFWYFIPELNKVFPPATTNCPNGWTVNNNGTCNIPPQGGMNLGNLNGKPVYSLTSGGITTYSTDINSGGMLLKDMYGNIVLGYTKLDFPGGYDISNIQTPVVDFTAPEWGETGSVLCANYIWATKNNIEWEGITNYNQCKE